MPGASSEDAQSMADNESKLLQMLHRSNEADEGEMMQLVKTEHVDGIESDPICQDVQSEDIIFESELDEVDPPAPAQSGAKNRKLVKPGGGNPDKRNEDEAERKRRSKRHCIADVGICNLPGQGRRESDGELGGESDGDAADPEMPALASLQDEETARRWLRWKEKTCEDALADGIGLLMLQDRAFCQTGPFCRPQNMTEQ